MAIGSFSAGLSGLNANGAYLGVIGNNLANINTVGFKASTVTFTDLVSQGVSGSSGNPMQVGLGTAVGSISPVFSQGSIESTQQGTNVALQGNGFFVVRNSAGVSFTRAGDFSFDASGNLVTPDGHFVQGYTAIDPTTGAVVTTGQPTNISVPPGVLRAPVATTQFKTQVNLDASAAVGATATTAIQIYDSLGTSHLVTITYTKTAANTWTTAATVPGAEVTGGTAGTPFVLATGAATLVFNASGQLATINAAAPTDRTITTPTWLNGAAASTFSWDIMDANNVASLTGFASPSATSSISQNGAAAGMMSNLTIVSDGRMLATFGSGQPVPVAQLAVANFNNPAGLVKTGSSKYMESQASGSSNIGVAGTGGRGTVLGAALEQSNVDVAQEFTKMILAQRGYQANAKTITTADQVLVDTLNMKQ